MESIPPASLVLLLKECDEDRGEHFGVNHVGLTCERLAAGVWQDFGQRISGMVCPGVTGGRCEPCVAKLGNSPGQVEFYR
jgi:hypothetical protein